jgi:hypothetical protein
MVQEAIVVDVGENNQLKVDTPVLVPLGSEENDEESSSSSSQAKQAVTILPITQVSSITTNPFMGMLPEIEYQAGATRFDVYVDRPVLFVVSDDGRMVQRVVLPTLQELETILEKYMEPEENEL